MEEVMAKKKRPNTNKKCSSCRVRYKKTLMACPKCGFVEAILTKQPKVRKPLKGGAFLKS
jgi:predicted RNA-binding Zn-ribbon protein involved in translation (DUF1610 family)